MLARKFSISFLAVSDTWQATYHFCPSFMCIQNKALGRRYSILYLIKCSLFDTIWMEFYSSKNFKNRSLVILMLIVLTDLLVYDDCTFIHQTKWRRLFISSKFASVSQNLTEIRSPGDMTPWKVLTPLQLPMFEDWLYFLAICALRACVILSQLSSCH